MLSLTLIEMDLFLLYLRENESCTDVENLPTFTSFKDIREGLSSLPSSWTILHLLQTTTAAGFSQIVAARFSRDKEPLIVSLPSSSTHQTVSNLHHQVFYL